MNRLCTKNESGKKILAVSLATAAILTTAGCSNMVTTATDSGSLAQGAVVKGQVHGGNQPVAFAGVQIFAAGESGFGSASTLLATTYTAADGSFSFTKAAGSGTTYPTSGNTYACPSGSDKLLYITVRAGNTVGTGDSSTQNVASVFLAPLGFCSAVSSSTQVNITEVTTAATVAALGQFINASNESIGYDGILVSYNAAGNAFKAAYNLVNQSTGLANTSSTMSGANTGGGFNVGSVSVTVTPETAKINTVADILSACINQPTSSGTACSTLFANTPPPTAKYTSQPSVNYPVAKDTLQAALYMFTNPTDGSTAARTNLFNLVPGAGAPFQPTLTSVPSDWTIGVRYTSTSTCGTASPFLGSPYDLGVDSNGNIWLANNSTSNSALVAITPTGAPLSCVTLGGSSKAGGVVDIAGNIWYGDSANNLLYRFTPGVGTVRTYNTVSPVLAIATDGSGNIFFTGTSGGTGSVYKVTNGANSSGVNSPVLISNTVGTTPSKIFPDTAGDLFVSSGSGFVTEVSSATGGTNFINGYTSTPFSVPSPSYGVVVGPANRVYVSSQDPAASVTVLAPTASTFSIQAGYPTAANTGGLSNPTNIWLDGALSSWTNNSTANSGSGNYSVAVIGTDGVAISASGNANGGYQKDATFLNSPRGNIIDSAGNLWVTNDNLPNSVTEFVGSAVPIYQPYSSGLLNGRFQTIP